MRLNAFVVPLAGLMALLAPSVASGVLRLNIGGFEIIPTANEQIVFTDVYVVDLDDSNERLTTFTIAIDAPRFSESGLRFAPPVGLPSPSHPYVFKDFPAAGLEDFGSSATRIAVGAELPGPADEVNVTDFNNGLFRIPLLVPANFRPPALPYVY